jgi:hypothetical protein
MNIIQTKLYGFLLSGFILISCLSKIQPKHNKCGNVKKNLELVKKNLANGIYMYLAKRVIQTKEKKEITYNKTIQVIVDETKIKPLESGQGTYTVTDSVIKLWDSWIEINCAHNK